MGFFDDILKGLPANATLREKNTDLESENAALTTEVAILKDQLREAKGEITKLEQRIEKLTIHINLDENDVLILKAMASLRSPTQSDKIEEITRLHLQVVKLHLQRLADARYLRVYQGYLYSLDQRGREYLIKNNLI
ncbi:hypothetical protein BH18ACI4_BH18ACI4_08700 [soil metagenome]